MQTINYAGAFSRIVASIIDSIIIMILTSLACIIITILIAIITIFLSNDFIPLFGIVTVSLIMISSFISTLFYLVWTWSHYNASLGQKICSLKLLNEDTTTNITTISLFCRAIILIITKASGILVLLNLLLIIFLKKKQTLQDLLTQTIVIKE
jgi:uncharacterized RDD family membrane protein YckC